MMSGLREGAIEKRSRVREKGGEDDEPREIIIKKHYGRGQ